MAFKKTTKAADPPKRWSDGELVRASVPEIEKHIAAYSNAARRIEEAPAPRTAVERKAALGKLDRFVAEIRRLEDFRRSRVRGTLSDPEVKAQFKSDVMHARALAAQTDEDKAFHAEWAKALSDQQAEREAKKKKAELRERRLHQPDPRAASITAAVLADELFYDGLKRKLRENVVTPGEPGTSNVVDVLFESEDVAVALILLKLLEERSEVVISDVGSVGRWPDPTLPQISRLRERLGHVRRGGFFEVKVEGGEARVSYGPEIRRIAARWAIKVDEPKPPAEAKKVAATA